MTAVQWINAPHATDVTYPAAPWHMTGQLWLSLFKVNAGDHPDREPGVYGAALVKYQEPSPLTYGELLVARMVTAPNTGKAVNITDIWVDSIQSVHGGRDLWAIPKDLCDFGFTSTTSGPLSRTLWTAELDGVPIVTASFSDVSKLAPRLPFKGDTYQQRADGEEVRASLTGSSKAAPCRGRWDFNPDGALGWLAGKRSIASFRQADFRMSFG
ncbi:acetoacetate decarboxylase family protein [Nocardioides marmorisolisilvae]|uniref:Acetoacetate decarboxylase n=1 Tax=Nocardioides marmorisolisilvae TaxID=1542737 RepID=A0A3N0DWR2_9ACTN|nr:acetoacetate decarboxylase family protein [Nocardioides marmorisolisilvae]RNL80054.1 hypothetical protein EFL95_14145 [Nocardioides marmorisolisilvae]